MNQGLTLLSGEDVDESPFVLYIFFNGEGNCLCLEDWPNWVDLNGKFGDKLQIKGVFNGGDRDQFLLFAKGLGLPFPLYEDVGGSLRASLKAAPGLVTKVLIGPSGAILFADTNQESPRDQRYFVERIGAHISHWMR